MPLVIPVVLCLSSFNIPDNFSCCSELKFAGVFFLLMYERSKILNRKLHLPRLVMEIAQPGPTMYLYLFR